MGNLYDYGSILCSPCLHPSAIRMLAKPHVNDLLLQRMTVPAVDEFDCELLSATSALRREDNQQDESGAK